MLAALGRQKRASDTLEPELWMALSHHMGAGNRVWLSPRAAIVLNLQAIASAPQLQFSPQLHTRIIWIKQHTIFSFKMLLQLGLFIQIH